jgi:hypothetical protein
MHNLQEGGAAFMCFYANEPKSEATHALCVAQLHQRGYKSTEGIALPSERVLLNQHVNVV